MSRDNSQPFDRGQTFYGPDGTIDSNDLKGAALLGKEWVFEDLDYASTAAVKPHRSGKKVVVRAVRNLSGVTVFPKDFVRLAADGQSIIGRVSLDSEHGYPVDEYVPAAGVRNYDVCYVVVEGPAMMRTAYTGAQFNADVAAGARLHSVTNTAGSTAAGSTAEAGRVATFNTVAATTVAQFNALIAFNANWVGTALTARTTANTNTDILVDVRRRW